MKVTGAASPSNQDRDPTLLKVSIPATESGKDAVFTVEGQSTCPSRLIQGQQAEVCT